MDRYTPSLTVQKPRLHDVVGWMRKFAHKDKASLEIRALVEKICQDVVEGDYASEALAIYYWVCQHIRYMRDINGVEFVKDPLRVLETGSGDCDDMATLLAAMLMAAGNRCQFVTVSFRKGGPPSHVFVEVLTPKGAITLDPVANRVSDRMLADAKVRQVWPVTDAAPVGMGAYPVGGKPGSDIYSVYRYDRGEYDYFRTPALGAVPPTGYFRGARGRTAEDLAAPLPSDATYVGGGLWARGTIATDRVRGDGGKVVAADGGGGLGSVEGGGRPSWGVGLALLVGGYLLWKNR